VKLTLTHEEIAEIIGTTRETVSRLFSEFKKKQLLQLKGSTLVIRSRAGARKDRPVLIGRIRSAPSSPRETLSSSECSFLSSNRQYWARGIAYDFVD
jgi:hypothetical protein